MTVEWVGNAMGQNNNFGNKHIVLVEEVPTEWESIKTVAGILWRVRNNKAPALIAGTAKKSTFGSIKPGTSTIIITTEAVQADMATWVEANVGATRKNVLLPVGAGIVASYTVADDGTSLDVLVPGSGSTMNVDVDVKVVGGVRCVYHLNGARIV